MAKPPIWPPDRTGPVGERGPIASGPVDGHTHGVAQEEVEAVTDLMARLGISCGHDGSHVHRVQIAEQGRGRTAQQRHHHHDLRCLVQAGRNEIKPALRKAERERDTARERRTHWEQEAHSLRLERDGEHSRANKAEAELDLVSKYMTTTPTGGPWRTIQEQYDRWLEERQEEQG